MSKHSVFNTALLLALIAIVTVAGNSNEKNRAQKEVRAERFVLVDAQGKARAMLRLYSDGSPGLSLLDAQDKPRAVLGLDADGNPALSLWDAQGRTKEITPE